MDDKLAGTLIDKIDNSNKLLALLVIKGEKQAESIGRLSSAGLQPKEIAELLGTTRNTVSVILTKLKKNKKKG